MRAPLVMKFGGTSIDGVDRMRNAAALARDWAAEGGVLVVLSALAGVTDALLACGRKARSGDEECALAELEAVLRRHAELAAALLGPGTHPEVDDAIAEARRELGLLLRSPALLGTALLAESVAKGWDLLAGKGEILSTAIFAAYLGAPSVDARRVVRTDSRFGSARPKPEEIRALAAGEIVPLLGAGKIVVTQGYIGADGAGTPTTLGRGGSDYSASLLGAAIDAAEIQIWTDVEGIMSCDPSVIPSARTIGLLSYDEAAELAAFGSQALHPATILPAVDKGIPVTVRSSLAPRGRFTTISREGEEGRLVTALASRGPVTIITVRTPRMLGGSGFLSRIFQVFERRGMDVDLVSTSEVAVSLTLDAATGVDDLVKELAALAEVEVERDRALVALVGGAIRKTKGLSAKALSAIGDISIEMISLGANEINLSIVLAHADAAEVLRRLHAAFFAGEAAAEAAPVPAGIAPTAEAPREAAILKVGIFGRGRLGSAVAALVEREPGMSLAWAVGRGDPPADAVDVALCASAAEAVAAHVGWAVEKGVDIVIGTTGWDRAILGQPPASSPEARRIGILVAANFSLAMAFMRRAAIALGRLADLDPDTDLAVVERHHRMKADAPSGTAKLLAAALSEGCPRYSGWVLGKAEEGKVSMASLRAGKEVGYHEMRLEAASETIVLSHEAMSRDIFARGALRAIGWIAGRKGFYTFDDMATKVIDPLFVKADKV